MTVSPSKWIIDRYHQVMRTGVFADQHITDEIAILLGKQRWIPASLPLLDRCPMAQHHFPLSSGGAVVFQPGIFGRYFEQNTQSMIFKFSLR
jgi:hypothetical protein